MTAPLHDVGADPTTGVPGIIATGVDALVENANRFGLTWRLSPGTVGQVSDPTGFISVMLDGDTGYASCVSLVGAAPTGSRVMVISIPPSNKYIVGWVGSGGQIAQGSLGLRTATTVEGNSSGTPLKDAGLGDLRFLAISGRRYHIGYRGRMVSAAVSQAGDAQIRMATATVTVANSTVIGAAHNYLPTLAGIGQSNFVADAYVDCPLDLEPGIIFVAPYFTRTAGSSTVTVNQSTGQKRTFFVEDAGPAVNRVP